MCKESSIYQVQFKVGFFFCKFFYGGIKGSGVFSLSFFFILYSTNVFSNSGSYIYIFIYPYDAQGVKKVYFFGFCQ